MPYAALEELHASLALAIDARRLCVFAFAPALVAQTASFEDVIRHSRIGDEEAFAARRWLAGGG
ncbi:hypothetical protein ABOZ73_08000 [Caulobacter sp. 73W]|uniref:Uncharacterized protein n=1 Tax=Caulobacter sp. 73W TaxID=3161137 RepID=A0AB39KYK5_9CAUL